MRLACLSFKREGYNHFTLMLPEYTDLKDITWIVESNVMLQIRFNITCF
jgi:hypothetical protein